MLAERDWGNYRIGLIIDGTVIVESDVAVRNPCDGCF
jgi:hypothetical protein